VLLLCRSAAGGRSALPGRDARDGGGPAAAHGGAGQEGRPPAHLPAVPAAGARPTRGLQEAARLPGRRSMVSQILHNLIGTPTKRPVTKCSATKGLATKRLVIEGSATKVRLRKVWQISSGNERSGDVRSGIRIVRRRKVLGTKGLVYERSGVRKVRRRRDRRRKVW
jgi:hypothetical protein